MNLSLSLMKEIFFLVNRNHSKYYYFGFFILILLLMGSFIVDGSIQELCLPENGTIWNGAFIPVQYHRNEMEISDESISSYINHSGKSLAIIGFSHEWSVNRSFPVTQVNTIHQFGAIPYIRLMIRTDNKQYRPEPIYYLKRIRDGYYDAELRAFGREARNVSYPILIEYGTEMNGWWFSWNGYWTGKTEGPELFKKTYSHIIAIMDQEGAKNLYWVFHINWHSNPEESWNNPDNYYPGDELIDIIGLSVYGTLNPYENGTRSFSEMMNAGYNTTKNISPTKPVIISEMGTDFHNPYTPAYPWIDEALSSFIIEKKWPDLIGFIWWNAGWPNDNNYRHNTTMRIEDNQQIQTLFRKYLANSNVLGKVC